MRPYRLPEITILRREGRTAFMKKIISAWLPIQFFDTTGEQWAFLVADDSEGKVAFRRSGKWVYLPGEVAAFLPPYSIVHWRLKRGTHRVHSVFSDSPLPEGLPNEPVAFHFARHGNLDVSNLFEALRQDQSRTALTAINVDSALARKSKAAIDAHYASGLSMGEMARRLGSSPSSLSKAFRACYGMTPETYEKQLRLYGALNSLVFDEAAIQRVALGLGFNNMSLFNRQFKAEFFTTPTELRKTISCLGVGITPSPQM